MTSEQNLAIAARFGRQSNTYDADASLQQRIALRLSGYLPKSTGPDCLEIGCGTGFFTKHLLDRYPAGQFLITDLSSNMLAACQDRFPQSERVQYAIMDGETPDARKHFDLIAVSMALQWLSCPVRALNKLQTLLKPGGHLIYSTIGPGSFPEWRATFEALGLTPGLRRAPDLPGLPGLIDEEHIALDFGSAHGFLTHLKAIGASHPSAGYSPLSAGHLRAALRLQDANHGGRVTWHIVYGRLIPMKIMIDS
ncbi:malonyl-[acyl-carrier protein] O-methyltransferase [bacterium MnTg02]|nr:malonyl-[acyl-carrier protein] O-methyltransferase [bacterium MnTg02]